MKSKYFFVLLSEILIVSFAQAQQKDYKPLLDAFYVHADNNFQDIIARQTDTASVFYPSKLNADIGEVKIGKFPNAVTLNWTIPLAQSQKVQTDVKEFIQSKFADGKKYQIVSDGTEEEGYKITNVYLNIPNGRPLIIFKTIYYKSGSEPGKSNFGITMYGK